MPLSWRVRQIELALERLRWLPDLEKGRLIAVNIPMFRLWAWDDTAYITRWRIDSEVLPLEWRQLDFAASEVRLDPGKTKNGEGRTFPMTRELRELLDRRRVITENLQRRLGVVCPRVPSRG